MLSPGLHRRQSRREHSQSDFFFFFFFLSEEGFPLELTWMHRGFLKSPHGSRSLAMANAEPSHTNKQKKEGKNIGRTLDVTHDTRRRLSDRAWVCFPPHMCWTCWIVWTRRRLSGRLSRLQRSQTHIGHELFWGALTN